MVFRSTVAAPILALKFVIQGIKEGTSQTCQHPGQATNSVPSITRTFATIDGDT